jgi:hypothetical protein
VTSVWLFVLVGLALVGATLYLGHVRKERLRAALATLTERYPGWRLTGWPCGLSPDMLAARTAATPRGDRRYGVRHGIEGPLTMQLAGREVTCDASLFQWTYEERQRNRNNQGHTTTSYRTRTELVALCRLPVVVPGAIRIGSESVLGRIGLTRGGQQVESSEFNRRFRVEGRDPALTVQLLAPALQQELLASYQGRSIHLDDDLLVLGGEPTHRDTTLISPIGAMPAMRQDIERLARHLPAQFLRAVAAERQTSGDADRSDGDRSDVDTNVPPPPDAALAQPPERTHEPSQQRPPMRSKGWEGEDPWKRS